MVAPLGKVSRFGVIGVRRAGPGPVGVASGETAVSGQGGGSSPVAKLRVASGSDLPAVFCMECQVERAVISHN